MYKFCEIDLSVNLYVIRSLFCLAIGNEGV